jgi:hypothetical protein
VSGKLSEWRQFKQFNVYAAHVANDCSLQFAVYRSVVRLQVPSFVRFYMGNPVRKSPKSCASSSATEAFSTALSGATTVSMCVHRLEMRLRQQVKRVEVESAEASVEAA